MQCHSEEFESKIVECKSSYDDVKNKRLEFESKIVECKLPDPLKS